MRISDWSSDVCSSDLTGALGISGAHERGALGAAVAPCRGAGREGQRPHGGGGRPAGGRLRLLRPDAHAGAALRRRSEEHTSELQSLMRISYAVFCLKKKKIYSNNKPLSRDNED